MYLLRESDAPVICRTNSAMHHALQTLAHPHTTHDDWLTPWGVRKLASKIRSYKPAVVAAHTSTAHGAAVRASQCPVVVHRRVDFTPSWTSRRKYLSAAGFIAVSDAVVSVLAGHGVPEARIVSVPDGVDIEALNVAQPVHDRKGWTRADDVPCLLAVGALVDHKAHRTLLSALARLPHARLLLVGSGPLRASLERWAGRIGVADRVQMLGQRDDVFGLLKVVDVFVHPSKLEGRGQAVIEALLAGTPVVATSAGGVPETVGSGGRIVPPECPDQLADAIRDVLAQPAQARSLAKARRDEVRRWADLDTYRRRTYEAYEHFASLTTHNDSGAIQGTRSDFNDARRFPTT